MTRPPRLVLIRIRDVECEFNDSIFGTARVYTTLHHSIWLLSSVELSCLTRLGLYLFVDADFDLDFDRGPAMSPPDLTGSPAGESFVHHHSLDKGGGKREVAEPIQWAIRDDDGDTASTGHGGIRGLPPR